MYDILRDNTHPSQPASHLAGAPHHVYVYIRLADWFETVEFHTSEAIVRIHVMWLTGRLGGIAQLPNFPRKITEIRKIQVCVHVTMYVCTHVCPFRRASLYTWPKRPVRPGASQVGV